MTTNRPLRLSLDQNSGDDRMVGRLCDERGAEHAFQSWLGLLTLLEHARVRASSVPDRHATGEQGTKRDRKFKRHSGLTIPRGATMDHICLTIPVLPSRGEAARAFMGELEGRHRSAYADSEQRIGI